MIHEIQQDYVKTETNSGITTIEFFHPQSNSLSGSILGKIAAAINIAGDNENCKVIVLRSGGNSAFCAGASLDELAAISNEAESIRFLDNFAEVINAMRKCPKFIIGRIHGKCVGGGVGLVAACDYALAVEGADVKLSELTLGIGPFVVGPAIERKIGLAAFSQMAIDSSWYSSYWAKCKGLYSELHSNMESLEEAILKLSSTLAHSSPYAMADLKKFLWQGTEHWDVLLHNCSIICSKLILTNFTKNILSSLRRS